MAGIRNSRAGLVSLEQTRFPGLSSRPFFVDRRYPLLSPPDSTLSLHVEFSLVADRGRTCHSPLPEPLPPMSGNPTNAPAKPQPASTPAIPTSSVPTKLSQFAVGTIPAFKASTPINYAAAASAKAKPSPPALNGKDAVAVTIAPSALSAAAPKKPGVAPAPTATPSVPAGPPRVSPAECESRTPFHHLNIASSHSIRCYFSCRAWCIGYQQDRSRRWTAWIE